MGLKEKHGLYACIGVAIFPRVAAQVSMVVVARWLAQASLEQGANASPTAISGHPGAVAPSRAAAREEGLPM